MIVVAIARLKADGLVQTRQGKGASVPEQPGALRYRLTAPAEL